MSVAFGCDRLLDDAGVLAGRRYGLLAHSAAVTSRLRPLHQALASAAGPPQALFAPEHGFYGVEQDMVAAPGGVDRLTGVPVVSLYGDSAASLRPEPEAFRDLDLLLIDLQDVGSRYYTYAASAVWAAEAAIAAGLEVWILDRPNPLGGARVEGNLRQPGFGSFVGAFRLPARHGLTLGELVRWEGARRGWQRSVEVWTVEGWHRTELWEDLGRPWIAPSPNMPTATTALLYPGSCLVEATTLSEGRGTARPFHLIGAPGIDPRPWVEALESRQLPGVAFLPVWFRPQFQKHAAALCGGVELAVIDRQAFRPYRTGVELLASAWELFGDLFTWRREPYEFEHDRPAIDLLTGASQLREALTEGVPAAEWIGSWDNDELAFLEERESFLLYREG